MNQILLGILKSHVNKQSFLNQLEAFNEKPNILAAVVACVDSRVLTSKLLCSKVGELFIERNPGNFVCCEKSSLEHFNGNCVTPGFLELTLTRCRINDIIICGHSDCRAMNLLNNLGKCKHEKSHSYLAHHEHQPIDVHNQNNKMKSSPLEKWIWENGCKTLQNFNLKSDILSFKSSIHPKCPTLELDLTLTKHLTEIDLLSQANVLQQMINVYSYEMLTNQLTKNVLRVHGMWFEFYSGNVLLYSRLNKAFLPVTKETITSLINEL
ncbi:unnamed protein product [Schistosoma rodhaini]|uniref:Carbonic anhydrase n=1 Tax=Schistosoma rodhaini TaxID=6188 RepID=A0AA85FBM4_9TREM|nr:unnamed protein product [Schistosoma rodhaini]